MKYIFFLIILLYTSHISAQITATNFIADDCFGNSHHLFNELDSGKVVILDFVMPCGSCIAPSKTVYDIINQLEVSNPGRILFYISDGFGNENCDSIITWAANNQVDSNTIIIANRAVTLLDYGIHGMPKIVVLGGTDHHVFFNRDDSEADDSTALSIAIDSALHATDVVYENKANYFKFDFFPNPVIDKAKINYTLEEISDIKFEIYSINNKVLFTLNKKMVTIGSHDLEVNLENYSIGNYLFKMSSKKDVLIYKFSVIK